MNYHSPTEAADAFRLAAIHKSKRSFPAFALMAVLGGAFIAFGGLLTVMVAGGMPGVGAANPGLVKLMAGALFPVGLIMVSVTGVDLFTSDCAGFTFPLLRKELPLRRIASLLVISYLFNDEEDTIRGLQERLGRGVVLKVAETYHQEQYDVVAA